jgi:small subunit ribosomal protein S33
LRKAFPDWDVVDEPEQRRLNSVQAKKDRGKGTPRKKKTKEEGKKFSKRRPGG